jgi:hypothetical protein
MSDLIDTALAQVRGLIVPVALDSDIACQPPAAISAHYPWADATFQCFFPTAMPNNGGDDTSTPLPRRLMEKASADGVPPYFKKAPTDDVPPYFKNHRTCVVVTDGEMRALGLNIYIYTYICT